MKILADRRFWIASGVLGLLVAGAIPFTLWLQEERRVADAQSVYSAANLLRSAEYKLHDNNADGKRLYWTGDVSGLFTLGLIPREIAEADAAPIHPLVDKPRPYHGYLFIAMEVGQGDRKPCRVRDPAAPTGSQTRHPETYGICVYLASSTAPTGKAHRSYLLGPRGLYLNLKRDEAPKPVLIWPEDDEFQRNWAICD